MNLSHFTRALTLFALVGTTLAAAPAEARFGKRSEPSKSNGSSSKSSSNKSASTSTASSHAASPVDSRGSSSSSDVHAATPVGSHREVVVEHHHSHSCGHVYVHGGYHPHHVYVQPAPVYVSESHVTYQPRPPQYAQARDEVRFDLGLTGQLMSNGAMAGVQLRVDFERLGFDLRADRMALLAEDGSGTFDTLSLADVGLTYSLLSGSHGRLRAHGGVYSVFAPDAIFVGPGGGLSTTLNLVGPLTMEADAQLVVFPFTELDAHAGLGLKLGPVEGRAGMRLTYLSDQGRLDGTVHAEHIVGPYVGIALVL